MSADLQLPLFKITSNEKFSRARAELTADLILPAEKGIPAAVRAFLTQPAMMERVAERTLPKVEMNRVSICELPMRVDRKDRKMRTQYGTSQIISEGEFVKCQPDCWNDDESVLEPNIGQKVTES